MAYSSQIMLYSKQIIPYESGALSRLFGLLFSLSFEQIPFRRKTTFRDEFQLLNEKQRLYTRLYICNARENGVKSSLIQSLSLCWLYFNGATD